MSDTDSPSCGNDTGSLAGRLAGLQIGALVAGLSLIALPIGMSYLWAVAESALRSRP